MKIDLSICRPGQKLQCKHNTIVTFIGPTEPGSYYDYYVKYDSGCMGTRTRDGFVFRSNRQELDLDVIEILPFSDNNKSQLRDCASKILEIGDKVATTNGRYLSELIVCTIEKFTKQKVYVINKTGNRMLKFPEQLAKIE